jgi:hypothetical protein
MFTHHASRITFHTPCPRQQLADILAVARVLGKALQQPGLLAIRLGIEERYQPRGQQETSRIGRERGPAEAEQADPA